MSTNHVGVLLRHVRRMIGEPPEVTADAVLLERFAQEADETAFAALMERHGPLVWSVSRRVARHEQDAEDVYQATFLLLARKAGAIRKKTAVGSWLYGVAHRLALRARYDAARRRQREARASGPAPTPAGDDLTWRELREALDNEMARLPDKYRAPLLLCYFEAMTQEEAARQLGWSKRSVKDRLERGRKRLRVRLENRGITLSMTLAGSMLAGKSAAPAAVTAATIRAAVPFAFRRSLRGAVSVGALALAEGALNSMVTGKLYVLAVALTAAILFGGYQLAASGLLPAPANENHALVADTPSSMTDRYGDPFPPGAVARLGTIRYRFGGAVPAFLPDSETVVSAGQGNVIKLWNARTGRVVREIDTGNFSGSSDRGMALSADGKRLAMSGSLQNDATPGRRWVARVFDLTTGKDIRTFERLPLEGVNALAITPDGKLLFTLDRNGKLRIEEIDTGIELLRQQFPGDVMAAITVSPDGSTLALGSGPNTRKLFVWRWQAPEEPREIKAGERCGRHLAFSPSGMLIAECNDTKPDVRIWDAGSGRLLRKLELPDHEPYRHYYVAFSPDGKLVAAFGGTNDGSSVHLWDAATGRFVKRLDNGGALAFSPDCNLLVAGSRVWDVSAGKELSANDEAHFGELWHIVTGAKDLVATGGFDHTIRIWNAATGKHLHRLDQGSMPGGVALSHNGRLLASNGTTDDGVCLWDVATGKRIYCLPGHGRLGIVRRPVVFTSDDKSFLTWGADWHLRKWDVSTGKAVAEYLIQPSGMRVPSENDEPFQRERDMFESAVHGAQFTPDGKWLVLETTTKRFIFDATTAKELRSFPVDGDLQIGMAISLDSKLLLSSAWGKSIETKLTDGTTQSSFPKDHPVTWWDLTTGERRRQIMLPEQAAGPVAFSPDGTQFAVASSQPGSRIRIIDVASGRELRKFEGLSSLVRTLAFMPDGKRLVSGMFDSSALVWDLTH
jgi:RNA polymerase sigma factor (sigma-70 family)